MSSDEAADNREDPGHLSFIIMRDTETFDGQERVMSRAAYDLHGLMKQIGVARSVNV